MRGKRGQALMEFALTAPVLLLILTASLDMMRMVQISNTVAEAARQGARQAVANAVSGDNPFSAPNGSPCSGTVLTPNVTGNGCLTDSAIFSTVKSVLGLTVNSSTLYSNRLAASCPLPPAGQASVCIAPAETGAAGTYADCSTARTSLGHEPAPGDLGARQPEWSSPQYKGCFMVQVTVVVHYSAITPLANWIPAGMQISSSTSMEAEF